MKKDLFKTQLDFQRMTSEFTLPFEQCSYETQKERMDTFTSNTQSDLNICLAADDIIGIFDSLGFTSEIPPDIELLRHSIVEVIQNRTRPEPQKKYIHDESVSEFEKFFNEDI